MIELQFPFKTLAACSALALALAISASPAPSFAADNDPPQVQQMGNVAYVSGGVSEEDRAALEPMARDFNVKMVFALTNGEYLSDTDVVVAGARGGQPVLEARSKGPWFFARLASGQYTVTATLNGRTQRRSVTVGARGLKTLNFRWNGGPREVSSR